MTEEPKPFRLSVSQVRTWLRCPRSWAYRYVMNYKEPPAWALIGGKAMDETLNLLYTERLKGRDSPVSALQDFFRENVVKAEKPESEDESSAVVDDGTRLLPVYMRDFAPHVEPVAVQKEVTPVISGVPFLGYIDLIRKTDSGKIVGDHKFTSRQPDKRVAASSLQLRAYSVAEQESHVEIISLVRRKRDPAVVVAPHFVTEDDVKDLERTTRDVFLGVKSQRYSMTDPANQYVCSPTACGFWNRCRGRRGGPEPIPNEEV